MHRGTGRLMASREDEVREVAEELNRLCDRLAASVAQLTAILDGEPEEKPSAQPG